jgi:hypothetical protein
MTTINSWTVAGQKRHRQGLGILNLGSVENHKEEKREERRGEERRDKIMVMCGDYLELSIAQMK